MIKVFWHEFKKLFKFITSHPRPLMVQKLEQSVHNGECSNHECQKVIIICVTSGTPPKVHEPGDIPRPWDIPFQGSYPLGNPMDCTLGHLILVHFATFVLKIAQVVYVFETWDVPRLIMGLGTSQGLQWKLGCPKTPVLGVGHPNSFLSMVGCPN
ncbi:hypothetical protein K435DRAFT_802578 [Dendrothele bispora CBS 962.96]|uniref:Uncharacterized protein n=1 Tax=Dendrothele bispora (strain CBS 962.96) TaxID=1314807 RepID=A0A4S8LKC9_DENBC|nr:hypothetical protein K435DRAFT_802578 [Dendrothele bispora CBS 962.96]